MSNKPAEDLECGVAGARLVEVPWYVKEGALDGQSWEDGIETDEEDATYVLVQEGQLQRTQGASG